ncbi:MAG: DUF4189 domain-containing protein [Chitinophagaceae bacterium]|nr:DUF4189 domain-containing protein [Chitinophagaceae bacterium]
MRSTLLCLAISACLFIDVAPKKITAMKPVQLKYGALAIDKNNVYKFGWSNNCNSLADAERLAIKNCNESGGDGVVVLAYSGKGCAIYRVGSDRNFAWAVGETLEIADGKAKKAANARFGKVPEYFVWSCNTESKGDPIRVYTSPEFKPAK